MSSASSVNRAMLGLFAIVMSLLLAGCQTTAEVLRSLETAATSSSKEPCRFG